MPNHLFKAICLSLLFAACKGNKTEQAPAKDSNVLVAAVVLPPLATTYFNDIARFIAGMAPLADCSIKKLHENDDWIKFSKSFDSLWTGLETKRLSKQRAWAKSETGSIASICKNLFYPFSGADFMNAHLFFPKAINTVMIGLEPPGTVPDVKKFEKDTLAHYFSKVRKSIQAIMKFSFYRTNSMRNDFSNEELDGTLPNILIFMARSGCHITNISPLELDANGNAAAKQLVDFNNKSYRGIRISYMLQSDIVARTLSYFSADIGNSGLTNDKPFLSYLTHLPVDEVTYLKSASYLMHKPYFSTIRNLILGKSKAVLQDDSGIPYRFFGANWNKQLYGTYDKPIKLFGNWYQLDFHKAFQDSLHIRKLGFGIGYDWQEGQSNLMLAIRNGEAKYIEGNEETKTTKAVTAKVRKSKESMLPNDSNGKVIIEGE